MTTEWGTWTELIESYREDLSELNKRKRVYSTPLKVLQDKKKNKERLSEAEFKRISELKQEVSLISNMITSTTYALNWLMSGKCPDNVTSIENYSYDQRAIRIDPKLIEAIYSEEQNLNSATSSMDPELIFKVDSALATLTKRERDVFELFEAHKFTLADISEMLSIEVSTVNTMLRRGRHKIKAHQYSDLFLMDYTI